MEPRLDLVLTRIWGTPAGYTASYVAEVRNFWSGGYFWILQSAQGGYEIYQLQSAWDFDLSYAAGVHATYFDLTDDHIPEVITIHSHRGGSGWTFENQTLDIFDLSTVPPAKIEFWPESPARWLPAGSHWNFHMNDAGQMIFQIEWYLDTYVCRQQFQSEFLLQGNVFIEQERHDMPTLLEFLQHSASPEYEPLCLDFYFGRLLREAANGHATALGMANEQLNILDVALQTEAADGFRPVRSDYPDYVEEQRFKLAIILASQGDYEEARFLLTRLASQSSNWSGAAWQFLQSYEHPADFLTACAWAKECVEYLPLQKLLSQLVPTQLAKLSTLFTGSFLRVESHLVQDLDGDSIPEQFLTLAKVNHDPQTWLLTVQDEKVVPFWMAYHDDGRIEQVTATDSHLGLPTYHLSGLSRFGAAFDVFFVQEQDDAGTAQYRPIGQYDYDFINSLESIAADLLEGEIAPEIALWRVRAVMSSPTFLCTEQRIQWTCHHQHLAYYLVGLAHELMGQEAQAVAAYLTLIEGFPDTPYAIMAAAKLTATSWDG